MSVLEVAVAQAVVGYLQAHPEKLDDGQQNQFRGSLKKVPRLSNEGRSEVMADGGLPDGAADLPGPGRQLSILLPNTREEAAHSETVP